MARLFLIIAALAGAASVTLGALGAHQIRDLLTPSRFDIYLTGVRYLLVHAVVLFVAAGLAHKTRSRLILGSCFAFLLGMIAFSGSLVLLGLYGTRILGAVAPVGGAGYARGRCRDH